MAYAKLKKIQATEYPNNASYFSLLLCPENLIHFFKNQKVFVKRLNMSIGVPILDTEFSTVVY